MRSTVVSSGWGSVGSAKGNRAAKLLKDAVYGLSSPYAGTGARGWSSGTLLYPAVGGFGTASRAAASDPAGATRDHGRSYHPAVVRRCVRAGGSVSQPSPDQQTDRGVGAGCGTAGAAAF